METEDRLEKTAFELLLLLCSALIEHVELYQLSNADLTTDPAMLHCWPSDRAYVLAGSVVEMLRPSPIVECSDVFRIVTSEFLSAVSEKQGKISNELVMKSIVERLRNPAQPYEFSVLISAGSGIGLDLGIGGSHKLVLSTVPGHGALLRTKLSGEVLAIDEVNAVSTIEQDIKSLIGTSLALGVAESLAPIVYSIPKISLKGGIEIEAPLSPSVGGLSSRIRFGMPNDLNELESRMFAGGDAGKALERRFRGLTSALTSESERGIELQNASKLLFDAFAAAPSGMAIAIAFMSMEAVLLDRNVKESITARLSEAVAYRLGSSSLERKQLRKQVSKLYEHRSSFVHTGNSPNASNVFQEALALASRVLQREVLDLEPASVTR